MMIVYYRNHQLFDFLPQSRKVMRIQQVLEFYSTFHLIVIQVDFPHYCFYTVKCTMTNYLSCIFPISTFRE